MLKKVSSYLLVSTILVQCVLHGGIPLMPHFLNDPAWYYMYKHFLFEGIWIQEELYPSFQEPILYYCPLGYPFLLYIAELVSTIFQCSFAQSVLQIQFIAYLASARFIWLICRNYTSTTACNFTVIAYLCYIPFFNYAHLLMSETWFITCLLASLYCFQCGVLKHKNTWIILAFCLSGYTFLVRPVAGVMLPIVFLVLLFHPYFKLHRIRLTLAAACFLIFPFIQSGFNHVVYNTWSLREGFSWNLWNRVVHEDGYDPNRSAATFNMKRQLHDATFVAQSGHWWDITSQLSHKGLKPKEIQEYCMHVCWDGIKADPVNYLSISLQRGLWTLPTEQQESLCIYSSAQEYREFIKQYQSQHHQPLLDKINEQSIGLNSYSNRMIWMYSYWNTAFLKMNNHYLYMLFYGIYILLIGLEILRMYLYRSIDPILVLLMSVPLAMSLAACSLEVIHNRYYLPGILLQLIFLTIGFRRRKRITNL